MSLDEITGDVENAVNKVLHCVVDRLESRPGFLPWVMLEMPAGDVLRIPSELLPEGIQEGDVVAITRGGSSVTLHLDSRRKSPPPRICPRIARPPRCSQSGRWGR